MGFSAGLLGTGGDLLSRVREFVFLALFPVAPGLGRNSVFRLRRKTDLAALGWKS